MTTPNNVLQPVASRGWLHGLPNLLNHELHRWWGTRRWLMQLLLWILLIDGSVPLFISIFKFGESMTGPSAGTALTPEYLFFEMASLCTVIGAVISAHGIIIQERQMGTAAWILSKPVLRSGFILAKLLAHAFSFLVVAVLAPMFVFWGGLYLFIGRLLAPLDLLAAAGVLSLGVLFYLSLTIMLGTFFNGRGAVLSIPLVFLFAGRLVPGVLPVLAAIFPWTLSGIAWLLALGPEAPQAVPPMAMIPVVATTLWSVIFTALAIWRFGKEEF